MNEEIITGNNSHGFANEHLIESALKSRRLRDITPHLKKFIKHICKEHNIEISETTLIDANIAKRERDPESGNNINTKPDLYIKINNSEFGISTKMGVGNSVHQEKVESFINWITKNPNITVNDKSIYDDLRLLIWGDGTLDGSAPIRRDSNGFVIGRFTTKEFKTIYNEKWKKIQSFLDANKVEILKRALFFGKTNKEVHYIYHGTDTQGTWISQNELLAFNIDKPLENSTFNVGRLSFQIYNSDKKGTPSGARKRGDVQFKYGNLSSDLELLMLKKSTNLGTFEGDLEEFNLSKLLNRNKNHKFWKVLADKLKLDPLKHYYVVKVIGKKHSRNSNKKVMCKTDNYLISTMEPISKKILLKNEYQLTENDLKLIDEYDVVTESGISVKQKNSRSYTISKLTIESFRTAFKIYIKDVDNYIQALILYCDKKQIEKNNKIAKDLKIDEVNFKNYFNQEFGINITNLLDYLELEKLKKLVKAKIKSTIEANSSLKDNLFKGTEWFDAPYYINFIYVHGVLTDEVYIPYNIDNGSGRSKGEYTIILKPS